MKRSIIVVCRTVSASVVSGYKYEESSQTYQMIGKANPQWPQVGFNGRIAYSQSQYELHTLRNKSEFPSCV